MPTAATAAVIATTTTTTTTTTGIAAANPGVDSAPPTRERARQRKSSKEVTLPEKLDLLVPESKLFTALLRLEQRIDANIARARLEINHASRSPPNVYRVLRICLSHSVTDDGFTFRIQGVLINPDTGNAERSCNANRFSNFVRNAVVQLDPAVFQDDGGTTLEWIQNDADSQLVDGFEVYRSTAGVTVDSKCRVTLNLKEYPERFNLPDRLALILGFKCETKIRILNSFWAYVKRNKLLDSTNTTVINCDEPLVDIFGCDQLPMEQISSYIFRLLKPSDPLTFQYLLLLNGDPDQSRQVFDVALQIPERPSEGKGASLSSSHADDQSLYGLQSKCEDLITSIGLHKSRYEFMSAFAESPIDTTRIVIANQTRDLKLINQIECERDVLRNSSFFRQDWVADAAAHYLNSLPATGYDSNASS